MTCGQIVVRRGTPDDAPAIVRIWESVVAERVHSAVDRPFTIESEREYLNSMSDREALFVANTQDGVVGFQTLDLWTKLHGSMDHVGQLGTFVLSDLRGRGIGRRLAEATLAFAASHRYEKLVVFVRGGNSTAQAFYRSIGFTRCGRLTKHVLIDGRYDDELVMERFL